ncbi:MAG: hypothetical protein M3088_06250 [Actinomycetota bacterium]|nr:hypothetical protein [Actinomycetota bacterium]
MVIGRICEVDLHAERVPNLEMGYLFKELVRRFAEQSNDCWRAPHASGGRAAQSNPGSRLLTLRGERNNKPAR